MSFYQAALSRLGFRQRAYQAAFAEGAPGHLALRDLALYSRAFEPDVDGLTHDQILIMQGRRQMFFRIFHHVKLSSIELETVARDAIVHAAARLQRQQGETE